MELDINKILNIYKQRIADLEHELILQKALNEQLEEIIEEKLKENE
jgi:hypothetical protein